MVRNSLKLLSCTFAVAALALVAPACSDSGDNTLAQSGALQQFCAISIEACTSVTQDECERTVTNAQKAPGTADLDCARTAKNCTDTAACLDLIEDGPSSSQPASQGTPDAGATSQPTAK